MEEQHKHIEELVNHIMKESVTESPSADFTSKIMTHVDAIANSTITTYKPLISKKAWIILSIIILGTIVYLFTNGSSDGSRVVNFDLSILTDNKLSNILSGLSFSKTIVYGVVLFALMFYIQIPLLKHHFEKRLNY